MRTLRCWALATALASIALAQAQAAKKHAGGHDSSRERFIGAWHLVRIDNPGPDGRSVPEPLPKGMLIYTRDGHMSVQLMYPKSTPPLSNQYVSDDYEASFGSYDVDEATHTLTHHVQGSITRGLLIGKDLPRTYEFTGDGHLIIKPARPDEHWSVTWEHD